MLSVNKANSGWTAKHALLCGLLTAVLPVSATDLTIAAGGPALQQALADADDGDVLRLQSGVHYGNFVVEKSIRLQGREGAVLDGMGKGDVLRIAAPNVSVRDLEIRNSGMNLTEMNAGIFVEPQAANLLLENNTLNFNAFGIWLDACKAPRIVANRVRGDATVRSQDRGNGIHLYAVQGGEVNGNEVWETRDGIYIDTSNDNVLRGNTLHDLRYGIHYMYSHSNQVLDNHTYNTRTGYALMQSKRLTVRNNHSEQDRNYGILMNFITHSEIAHNRVEAVREGSGYAVGGASVAGAEGKALFVYNAQFNEIRDNHFSGSDIGIHLTAGSEDNRMYGNQFIGNRVQVKYVANRPQEWSHAGRGNYWSDYLGWDLDADGRGDKAYEPNDAVDKLLWKYPLARLLMSSPAVETLRWVQTQFPVLRPQGVRDSHPLMHPASAEEVVAP